MSQRSGGSQATLAVERHGIEHVETGRRYGKASSQFTARFAPVIYLAGIFVGATGGEVGLGVLGSITAIIAGNLLGAVGTGLCALMGPKLGMPQLPMGRAPFGYVGNYLPAALSLLVYVGYYSVGTVLGAESLGKLFGLPYAPMVVVTAGLSILIGIYGYRMLHSFGKWITRISIVVLAVVSIVMISRGVGSGATSTLSGAEYATAWLLQFTVVFGYTVSWAPYASDYSRYLPESTSSRSVFGWASSGLFAATTWMMILGAVLITVSPSGDVIDAFGIVLPDWLVFVTLLTLGISAIPHNSVNLYSGAMATLTCGLKLRQSVTVVAAGVIGGLIALAIGGEKFEESLQLFLHIMSYYITPWLAILLANYFRVYRSGRGYPRIGAFYDRDGVFGRVNVVGIGALVVGVAVSVPFIGTEVFTGPIADRLGGADLSYFVSGTVAAAIYLAFEKPVNEPLSMMEDTSQTQHPGETS